MKQSKKILIGLFAAIGVVSTGTMISSKVFAQDAKPSAMEQQVKGQDKDKDNEKEEETQDGPMTPPVAKITPVQAMKAAEGKLGGKATMALFEFGEGHWTYGVILVKDHKLTEVDVDPSSGKVGDSEAVTPDDEAVEFKEALEKMVK